MESGKQEYRPLKAATLTRLGACAEQLTLFRAIFGKEAQVTATLCREHASRFDWHWAAKNLLSASGGAAWNAATAAPHAACNAARAGADAAYDAARAGADAAYDAAMAAPRAAYDAAMAAPRAAWDAAMAEAFGTLYVREGAQS